VRSHWAEGGGRGTRTRTARLALFAGGLSTAARPRREPETLLCTVPGLPPDPRRPILRPVDPRQGQAAGAGFDRATASMMPEQRVARLHLLRHAAVGELSRRVVRGQRHTGFAPEAEEQERALTAWLVRSGQRFERLISSDLERCRRLAERLGSATGLEPRWEPRLREQSMGTWEGRSWEEISAAEGPAVRAYWQDYVHTAPPQGESLAALAARTAAWWEEARPDLLDRRTLLVTHVGTIRTLLCHLLGWPLDQCLRLAPAVASHSELVWSAPGAVLEVFGERPWLAEAGQ
jgi:alpha-ribazole phosphatase